MAKPTVKPVSLVKLSKTSKLDGIKSWSLQAIDTCPGSRAADGGLVDACKGCYATTGNYRFANVKKPRLENREKWTEENFVSEFIKELAKETHFRWFDSGDVYSIDLAEKIYAIMENTPHVKHWIPTRMYKFAKFRNILEKMASLPNVAVRYSSDSVSGKLVKSGVAQNSTIIPDAEFVVSRETVVCRAYENAGKCNGCRACYDKGVKTIAYVAHGVSMKKVIRLMKQ